MPRNLKNKISLLLDDLETLQRFEQVKKIEEFVISELNFNEGEHELDQFDLVCIKSTACDNFRESVLSITREEMSEDKLNTWCTVDATIEVLRRKGLIPFTLTVKKNK